ncbi:MAG: hypothetical protein ABUS79_00155 [Pseudomonadota bacterium]
MIRSGLLVTVLLLVGVGQGGTAGAAEPNETETAPAGAAVAAPPGEAPTASPASSPSPRPSSSAPADSTTTATDDAAATGGVPMVDAAAQAVSGARYGVGARMRVTSVPKWMLGLFLDESVPLTSYTAGLEFFRRNGNFDFVLGVAYQSLSPSAGNWLGKGNPSSTDTDYIQFDGLAAYSVDAAFILHTEFNEYVGMHYGGGVGIGITTGRMLRTSAGSPGCANDAGNVAACFPCRIDPATQMCSQRITDGQLPGTEGGTDTPESPSRFSDSHVPTVYPIVNLITGLDIRLPNVPGFAIKVDLGYFFPYFFAGLGAAYQI